MNGHRILRASMWVFASGVAVIAAIVSYSHIYDLGRANGGSILTARLLPLSVDMLIVVGELMLLHEADGKGDRFPLGWVLMLSGIAATLAANVAYGAQFGPIGALIWGWPAYSFVLAASGMIAIVRRAEARASSATGDTAAAGVFPLAGKLSSPLGQPSSPVPSSAEEAAEALLRATHAAGNPVTVNALKTNFGLTLKTAKDIYRRVTSPPPELALAAPPGEPAAPPAELALANGHGTG